MIYAVVKRYEQRGFEYADWHYKPNDYYAIYNKLMELTDNNHELSEDAASWCENAPIEAIYETDYWEIEIMEIE